MSLGLVCKCINVSSVWELNPDEEAAHDLATGQSRVQTEAKRLKFLLHCRNERVKAFGVFCYQRVSYYDIESSVFEELIDDG